MPNTTVHVTPADLTSLDTKITELLKIAEGMVNIAQTQSLRDLLDDVICGLDDASDAMIRSTDPMIFELDE